MTEQKGSRHLMLPTVCQAPCEKYWVCSRVIKTRFALRIPYVIMTYGSGRFPASPGSLTALMPHTWDRYQIRQTCGEVCSPWDTIIWEAARTYGTSGDVEEKRQKGLHQNTSSFIVFTCLVRFSKIRHLKINANNLWSPTATGPCRSIDGRCCTWVSYMCSEIYFHWEWFGEYVGKFSMLV